jgi:hypothetical protein
MFVNGLSPSWLVFVSFRKYLFCVLSFAVSFELLMNSGADFMTVVCACVGCRTCPLNYAKKLRAAAKKQHPFDLAFLIPTRHKPCETGNKVDDGTRDDPCKVRGVSGAARGALTIRGTRLLMVRATFLLLHGSKTSSISE